MIQSNLFCYLTGNRAKEHIIKIKYTPAVRSKILSKLILQAVCDTPIARITGLCPH